MSDKQYKKYEQLQLQEAHGKNQKADQLKKEHFDVYLCKRLVCKALFFHFVRIGAKNISIPKLLKQWQKFKHTRGYQDMVRSSVAKSACDKQLNSERAGVAIHLK